MVFIKKINNLENAFHSQLNAIIISYKTIFLLNLQILTLKIYLQ